MKRSAKNSGAVRLVLAFAAVSSAFPKEGSAWAGAAGPMAAVRSDGAAATSGFPQIIVDQIGYAPGTDPMVIFSLPVKGQNSTPALRARVAAGKGFGKQFEVRTVADDKLVLTGDIKPWKPHEAKLAEAGPGGATIQTLSGDVVWWGDLSALTAAGQYYIVTPETGDRSYAFAVGNDIYHKALRASVRTYYYQRCGTAIVEKYSGDARWTHPPCHVGVDQDKAARLYPVAGKVGTGDDKGIDATGGWHDAGDYTKYTFFTVTPLWTLLEAQRMNPTAFSDDTEIPESGNGVPDVLDECKWELDYLLKLQQADGGVFNRVGTEDYPVTGSPEKDIKPRRRTQVTTWATACFAGVAADAAVSFQPYEKQYPGYSAKLREVAEKAWRYLEAHPDMLPADGTDGAKGKVVSAPGESNTKQDKQFRLFAATHLLALTDETQYRDYFDNAYKAMPADQRSEFVAFDGVNNPENNYTLVGYLRAKSRTPEIAREITEALRSRAELTTLFAEHGDDAYRAYVFDGHYCWGSNSVKSGWGSVLVLASHFVGEGGKAEVYRRAAAGYMHFIHGRNALNLCYLTNAGSLGASRSAMKPYHTWFNAGVVPPPGYLVGGPNQFYDKKFNAPPFGEPPMKAYLDFQRSYSQTQKTTEDSWAITEPAIYYQGNYTLLLSEFAK